MPSQSEASLPTDPNCPYPPSDPFCHTGPTTTTTLPAPTHVIIDNNGFAGNPQMSVDAGPDPVQAAIQQQGHAMVVGFVAVGIIILLVGVMLAGAITGLKGRDDSGQD